MWTCNIDGGAPAPIYCDNVYHAVKIVSSQNKGKEVNLFYDGMLRMSLLNGQVQEDHPDIREYRSLITLGDYLKANVWLEFAKHEQWMAFGDVNYLLGQWSGLSLHDLQSRYNRGLGLN